MPVASGVCLAVMAVGPFAHDAHAPLLGLALAHDAEIVRRARGLEFDPALKLGVVHPVEHLLIFRAPICLVIGNLHAAADGHQQEQMQRLSPEPLGQRQRLGHLVRVVASHRRVDLVRDTDRGQVFHTGERTIEGASRRGRYRAWAHRRRQS